MCFSKRYSAVISDTERDPHGSCVPDHWRGGLNLAVGQIALPGKMCGFWPAHLLANKLA
jgi:hypothetical protein